MKVDVAYFSKTGHSKKIAEVIAKELSLTPYDLKQTPALDCDLLFLVTGVYGGEAAPEVLSFIDTLSPDSVRKVCLVTSSMGNKPPEKVHEALRRKNISVAYDEYTCKGSFLFFGMGHPSASEVEGAAEFARKAAEKLA